MGKSYCSLRYACAHRRQRGGSDSRAQLNAVGAAGTRRTHLGSKRRRRRRSRRVATLLRFKQGACLARHASNNAIQARKPHAAETHQQSGELATSSLVAVQLGKRPRPRHRPRNARGETQYCRTRFCRGASRDGREGDPLELMPSQHGCAAPRGPFTQADERRLGDASG